MHPGEPKTPYLGMPEDGVFGSDYDIALPGNVIATGNAVTMHLGDDWLGQIPGGCYFIVQELQAGPVVQEWCNTGGAGVLSP